MKLLVTLVCCALVVPASAQSLGGSSVYPFLDLPNTPQLTALGGVNISNLSDDAGLSFANPALLRPSMHGQLCASFNSMYAGIDNYSLWAAARCRKWQTMLAAGLNYFDYGQIVQTDASGNILGDLRPADYVAQVAASRRYEQHWYYGITLKFIHSAYGIYRSSGAALDVGVSYCDSSKLFQVSFTARNMGVQFKPYAGTTRGELPLDLELGVTKRLAKAPLQFSLTATHLQTFAIRYNDTAFNNDNGLARDSKGSFGDNLFRHLLFAVQAIPEDRVEITLGYSYLRRKELDIGGTANGLTGFSMGIGVLLKKWQIRYARSYYQNSTAYDQFGLDLSLND